jgi:hypothetical protein
MRILNQHKKQLADIVTEHNLRISDFQTNSTGYSEFKIKFKEDYFSFSILKLTVSDKYRLTVFPVDNTEGYNTTGGWAEVLQHYRSWLKGIQAEVNTPTGWETYQDQNLFNNDFLSLNEPFTDEEKKESIKQLNNFKSKILTIGLDKSQIDAILLKLDELESKMDVLNKFDWKSLLVGSLIGLIMTLSIPPDAAGILWFEFKNAFNILQLNF